MKIFAYHENLDQQQKKILSRIRQLMNGETSAQLQMAGMNYQQAYGVSLVHLRQLARNYEPNNQLADRLWFRNIRETMILATMVAQAEAMTDAQILAWAEQITNIELAEQVAFNLLGRKREIGSVVEQWIFHPAVYVRYTALMAIGWHFRFNGNALSNLVNDNLLTFEALASDQVMLRAVTHCLKMAGRFNPDLTGPISRLAKKWQVSGDPYLQTAGQDVLEEILQGTDNLPAGRHQKS
jgi:3-methyladenine DNA glycosylase AlkD